MKVVCFFVLTLTLAQTLHSPINSGPNSPSSPSSTQRVVLSGILSLSIEPSQPVLKIQIPSPSLGPFTGSHYHTAPLIQVSPRLPPEPRQEAPPPQSPTLSTLPSQQPPMGPSSSPTALSAPLSNELPAQAPPKPAPARALPTAPTPHGIPLEIEPQQVGEVSILSRTRIPLDSSSSPTEAVASPPYVPNIPGPLIEGSDAESGGNPPCQAAVPSEQERATSQAPSQQAEDVPLPHKAPKMNWFRKHIWDYKKGK
jgi:hypothetical protein